MEQALRPHRGGTVLAVGILSFLAGFLLIPLGILAWVMGSTDLKAMRRGEVDPAGRSLTQMGLAFGIGGLVCMIGPVACLSLLVVGGERFHHGGVSYSMGEGTRIVTRYYPEARSGPPSIVKSQHREVERPGGIWVKEGPARSWTPDGRMLEEGSYRDGKREGEWVFWNEDGSMDLARSGVYENDVRVQAGRTPPGDYPHDY